MSSLNLFLSLFFTMLTMIYLFGYIIEDAYEEDLSKEVTLKSFYLDKEEDTSKFGHFLWLSLMIIPYIVLDYILTPLCEGVWKIFYKD